MIKFKEDELITDDDIGKAVVYMPFEGAEIEVGAITSFNDNYIFVRYKKQHPTANGQATKRCDLFWEH